MGYMVSKDDGWRMPDWLWERVEPLLPPGAPIGSPAALMEIIRDSRYLDRGDRPHRKPAARLRHSVWRVLFQAG